VKILRKLGWLLRRGGREVDLNAELECHLDEEAQAHEAAGVAHTDARFAARRELGNLGLVAENTRAAWGWTWSSSSRRMCATRCE
jgi:hypothetical protein